MPIDKLEKDETDFAVKFGNRVICCSECGESLVQLYRKKDENGNKIKPAKYICSECKKHG
jgi:hypothetical protein